MEAARVETRGRRHDRSLGIRSSSAISRSSWPAPCLRKSFVAPFRPPERSTPAPLAGVGFFDRYLGKGIPDGAVSLSVRLTFQAPDRTLTDAEVQASVDAILARLVREHGAGAALSTRSEDPNMAKVATRSVELEPIDRLEEKLKLLVAMVDRMKADEARMAEENQRLARELESMRARSDSDGGRAVGSSRANATPSVLA